MLDISYPYLLAVEIGQRKLSESLARRITWRFGISSNIRDKEAAPMAWDQNSKKLVPYSLEMFRQHTSQLPTFLIPPDMEDAVTPSLRSYGRACHVALDSAQGAQRLGAALHSLFAWFAEHFSSDAAVVAFLASARKLYPRDPGIDAARRAMLGYGYDLAEQYYVEKQKKSQLQRKRRRKRKRV